jgi:DnaJ like chaperone protein
MIWGKTIGLLLGLKVGGFLGALVGLIVGHWLDKHLRLPFGQPRRPPAYSQAGMEIMRRTAERQEIFTTSVVALAAKLAKVDGAVTREEIAAFKGQFNIPPAHRAAIGALYDDAKRDSGGYEGHARQLADTFADTPLLLTEVLESLYTIAVADGRLHPAEREFLERVAVIFGFTGRLFDDTGSAATGSDPYQVLGVARDASLEEIKAAWRKLTREHHPDTLMAKGMPQEYIELATRKMADINSAYDLIRTQRGSA